MKILISNDDGILANGIRALIEALAPCHDVYVVAPNTKHWHGAAKDSWFAHLSIMADTDKAKSTWLEPVDEDYYNNLK